MDRPEQPEVLVQQEVLVLPEVPDQRVPQVHKVKPDPQEAKELPANKESPVKLDQQEAPDPMAHKGLRESKESQVNPELRAHKV